MTCSNCGNRLAAGSRFCGNCGTGIAGAGAAAATAGVGTRGVASAGNGLLYPRNPPLSPHLTWLNLLLIGLPQLLFGQVGKGLLLFAIAVVSLVTFVGPLLVMIASLVDAYMVGSTLRKGQPVGRWQFFPSA